MNHTQFLPEEHHEPDSWHRHSDAEGRPMAEHGSHVNVTVLSIAFVAMTLFMVVAVAGIIVYFDRHTREVRQHALETTTEASDYSLPYRQQAKDQLDGFGWAADGSHIRIPVEVAKQQIVTRYAQGGGH